MSESKINVVLKEKSGDDVREVATSNNGRYVAYMSKTAEVVVYEYRVSNNSTRVSDNFVKAHDKLAGQTSQMNTGLLKFTPDSCFLVTGGASPTEAYVYDVERNFEKSEAFDLVTNATFTPNHLTGCDFATRQGVEVVCIASYSGGVLVCDFKKRKVIFSVSSEAYSTCNTICCPKNSGVMVIGVRTSTKKVCVLDLNNDGNCLATFQTASDPWRCVSDPVLDSLFYVATSNGLLFKLKLGDGDGSSSTSSKPSVQLVDKLQVGGDNFSMIGMHVSKSQILVTTTSSTIGVVCRNKFTQAGTILQAEHNAGSSWCWGCATWNPVNTGKSFLCIGSDSNQFAIIENPFRLMWEVRKIVLFARLKGKSRISKLFLEVWNVMTTTALYL